MQSDSPEQRAVAIEAAAQAIQHTLEWRQKRKFMSPQQLSTWEPLVRTGILLNSHHLWQFCQHLTFEVSTGCLNVRQSSVSSPYVCLAITDLRGRTSSLSVVPFHH